MKISRDKYFISDKPSLKSICERFFAFQLSLFPLFIVPISEEIFLVLVNFIPKISPPLTSIYKVRNLFCQDPDNSSQKSFI